MWITQYNLHIQKKKGYGNMKKMKKMKKRLLSLLCVVVLLLSGCTQNKGNISTAKLDFNGYPMETEEKLTLWVANNAQLSTVVDNFAKTPFAKELAKRTGVDVEYIHPVIGQESTSISLLVAADEMPDMIAYNWSTYNGGPQKQIDEGVILPLNDLIEEHAPNLKKYLEEHPEIDKMIKTDDGTYYAFPFIRGGERLLNSKGQVIRRDWLEKYNLETPETVEDLENVLRTFKENGVKYPLCMNAWDLSNKFMFNFNTYDSFYLDNGKLTYGPMTSNYKEAIKTLNKWYKEGLLDPNYVSMNDAEIRKKMINNEIGVSVVAGGGGLGVVLDTWESNGSSADMVGFPYMSYNGKENKFVAYDSQYPGVGSIAITTSCKNPALAVRYLDYGYSEEGSFFYNFGVEGVAHNIVDGEPVFSENITNNPDGLAVAAAMMMYMRSSSSGPFIQDERYIDQYYAHEQQRESLDAWLEGYDDKVQNNLPPISRTQEEEEEYIAVMTEVNAYVSECRDKFITGAMPLDEWDNYIKTLKKYGIDKAIKIQQDALERYNKK